MKDELADKVLIPILGDQYGAVLERQELSSTIATARSWSATTTSGCRSRPTPTAMVLGPGLDRWLREPPGAATPTSCRAS